MNNLESLAFYNISKEESKYGCYSIYFFLVEQFSFSEKSKLHNVDKLFLENFLRDYESRLRIS